ncbi:predicted protein [Naegleria gruberi]|uniref:Predicted protein n=1 Tax=Naegleria gruberi TaxID=5762 RepID=D2V617_NAEGR|nr:uncharacterized protein NAEGRDRAFT_44367 [Naegleria gruberi]EFC47893.1 predicted protein [Naegleria gruberi]|eukprot:XP_002680637.1 predicted protein [Naegleria gruberi strain NEG-M]
MENFIDDETLLKCILPLSREYEDYSLDLIYRRNIGRGDAMLSFIFNYKTIAQITQSAETSEEESLLFSSEMFDKLFQNNVLKVIDLHDFCKHSTQIAVPLMLQYSRQCEEFIKVCKKAKKKIVSPTSLVEGTVFPTSPVVENPDVFLLGEQHFNFKRLKQGVLSPRSALPVLQDESLEKKQALLHKRYYQLVSLLNLILSVDYLKTWQWCIMNDMSMFRRISSKNGEKLAKIPKSVKRKEEEAFLFYRELFFNTREIKKIKSLTIYKKTLEFLVLQMIEGDKPIRNHEEKKAFLLLVSIYDKINEDQPSTSKKIQKKIMEFCSKHLIQSDDGLSRFELYESTTFNTKFFIEKCCPILKKEMDKK